MPSVAELKKEARYRGIKGYSTMNKAALEKALGKSSASPSKRGSVSRKSPAKKASPRKASSSKSTTYYQKNLWVKHTPSGDKYYFRDIQYGDRIVEFDLVVYYRNFGTEELYRSPSFWPVAITPASLYFKNKKEFDKTYDAIDFIPLSTTKSSMKKVENDEHYILLKDLIEQLTWDQ